jgi:sulfate adenylyltransferase subunit 1
MDALKFITCGSVDDGKSTLIGRLLLDSKAVLQDHLAGIQRGGEADLALLTDGLTAEREQGITIDVAYRYFGTERRKFIIGDAPGHEQYTRNMVTAASSADAAVVLIDATKLEWRRPEVQLLPQTRRHSLLCQLLRVPSVVFAINKLDAVADPTLAYQHIAAALQRYAHDAGIAVQAIVPVSALKGWNVVEPASGHWCGYNGPPLLGILEGLPCVAHNGATALALPVQWTEKPSASAEASWAAPGAGRRVFWGRVAAGAIQAGDRVQVFPGGQTAVVVQVLDHARMAARVPAGRSAGVVLDRELDISRGDWLLAAPAVSEDLSDGFDAPDATRDIGTQSLVATVAWLDDEPLVAGRVYWALHGHRWVKARVKRLLHRLDIHTLTPTAAEQLDPNAVGQVELQLQEAIPARPYQDSRLLGSLILVDTASHKTSGAVLVN